MNTPNHDNSPLRFDFSDLELVAHLDMVGSTFAMLNQGVHTPKAVMEAAIIMLRCVRDDLASRANIGTEPQYDNPAYLAESAIRDIIADGVFDRNGENLGEGA